MKILGIDTSCDDTCVALLEIRNLTTAHSQWAGSPSPKFRAAAKFDIKSNVVSSQVKLHAKYGGVYPFLAKREHQKNLPAVFKKATKGIDVFKIDLVGVTIGPGLEPCLWQGVNFAKELAKKFTLQIIPVNHVEAHIYANFLNYVPRQRNLFPAICLVVSGGHTQLILMKNHGQYKILGETRDDAAGECFDKAARILGLDYPGGPIISKLAKKINNGSRTSIILPRPMIYQKNYDFSFSGLKTAVLYDFRSRSSKIRKSKEYIRSMCAEIQQATIDVLIKKTLKAAKDFKVKSIILGGGVAANDELRKQFSRKLKSKKIPSSSPSLWSSVIENCKLNFLVPPKNLCTDNAAMVAVTAYFRREEATKNWQKIKVNTNLKI